MKLRFPHFGTLALCAWLFAACSSTSRLQAEQVNTFTSVVNQTPIDVYYQPAGTCEVIINGTDEDRAILKAEVKHSTLTISIENKKGSKSRNFSNKVAILVKAPTLSSVATYSSGDFISKGEFSARDFTANVYSSGSVTIPKAKVSGKLLLMTSSSGSITFSGTTSGNVQFVSNSSGDIKGHLTSVNNLQVAVNSSGSIEADFHQCDIAAVACNSSGDVRVKGEVTKTASFAGNSTGNVIANITGHQTELAAASHSAGNVNLNFKSADKLTALVRSSGDVQAIGSVTHEARLSASSTGDMIATLDGPEKVTAENKSVGDMIVVLKNAGDVTAACYDVGDIILSGSVRSLQRNAKKEGEIQTRGLKFTK